MDIFDVSTNPLQEEIPPHMDLSNNNLSGYIPQEFGKGSNDLRFLRLSNNNLHGPFLPTESNFTKLLSLHLANNNFMGRMPDGIMNSKQLKWNTAKVCHHAMVEENKLEGPIPIDICQLRNISILDLSQNNLSGGIPSCLNNIAFRRLDSLYGNVLGKFVVPWTTRSTEFAYFPDTNEVIESEYNIQDFREYQEQVVFMSKSRYESYRGDILDFMSGLDLSHNKLTGQIPPQMGYLSGIHTLNLSNNHLTGPIPETFSNLKQLESLDLSHNMLSGHIPSQLTGLYYLSVFLVAHNNLSGRTPERVNQFATFEASSYEGNPLLCGSPLDENCSSAEKHQGWIHIHPLIGKMMTSKTHLFGVLQHLLLLHF
ncbi:Leucine-rich repeat [Sesbania bispinosa]|nr:Leucine-rich repeat [Sesbania bispinosa]